MKDTHPLIEEKYLKMMMERTGAERLKMGFEMYEMARKLVTASIKESSEGQSELPITLFNRFYGDDLPDSFKQNVTEKLKFKGVILESAK